MVLYNNFLAEAVRVPKTLGEAVHTLMIHLIKSIPKPQDR